MKLLIALAVMSLTMSGASDYGAPENQDYEAELHLAGDATHRGNDELVPDAAFQYELNVTGPLTTSGAGTGSRVSGTLTGTITISYEDNGGTVLVEESPLTVEVQGEQSSYLAQGLDGLRLTVQQTGTSGDLRGFVIPGAFTTQVNEGDDGEKTYAVAAQGTGQAQFRDTQHWQLDVAGTLTMTPA